MLFNSQIFLLLFLPLTLLAYYRVSENRAQRQWLLIAASIFFYGYWDCRLVPLLAGSIIANWPGCWAARANGGKPAPQGEYVVLKQER